MITEAQITRVRRAIDLAISPGRCLLTENLLDTVIPSCIIGQLLCLEGHSPEEMRNWVGAVFDLKVYTSTGPVRKHTNIDTYPMFLLSDLQFAWDHPYYNESMVELKKRLHGIVDKYLATGD